MLREYQENAVAKAATWRTAASPTDRLLLASPTSTGKSYVALAIMHRIPGRTFFVTPSLDIIAGMLTKLGVTPAESNDALATQAAERGMYTPVRLRNLLLSGSLQPPDTLIEDEAHHDEADTHGQIDQLCACPKIGLTATPYRGTPRGTIAFRKKWGEPYWCITLKDAIAAGYWALPTCQTWPLVDDDLVEVSNGELVISQVESAYADKLEDLVERCRVFFQDGKPTRRTVFAFSSSKIADAFQQLCMARNLATCMITQGTPRLLRSEIFRRVAEGSHALINVRVVGEGVDLPIQRFVDCAPCMSPVLWMQRFGRFRVTDCVPEYICTNNNLQRHFYLLEGCMPLAVLSQSIAAFGKLTQRAGVRAFGLESIGKLRAVECKLTDGLTAHFYAVSQTLGASRTDFSVIVHPALSSPVWAKKASTRDGETMAWGRWELCSPPSELQGFRSIPARAISVKQADWWQTAAKSYGLAEESPNAKLFQVLPVLSNLKVKLA